MQCVAWRRVYFTIFILYFYLFFVLFLLFVCFFQPASSALAAGLSRVPFLPAAEASPRDESAIVCPGLPFSDRKLDNVRERDVRESLPFRSSPRFASYFVVRSSSTHSRLISHVSRSRTSSRCPAFLALALPVESKIHSRIPLGLDAVLSLLGFFGDFFLTFASATVS